MTIPLYDQDYKREVSLNFVHSNQIYIKPYINRTNHKATPLGRFKKNKSAPIHISAKKEVHFQCIVFLTTSYEIASDCMSF